MKNKTYFDVKAFPKYVTASQSTIYKESELSNEGDCYQYIMLPLIICW